MFGKDLSTWIPTPKPVGGVAHPSSSALEAPGPRRESVTASTRISAWVRERPLTQVEQSAPSLDGQRLAALTEGASRSMHD
jgi:hypothetical protein